MERDDETGALAAAKYYVGLFEYVYLTGDLEAWNTLAARECGFCEHVAEEVTSIHDAGGYRQYESFEFLGDPEIKKDPARKMFEVTLQANEGPSVEYDADGKIVNEAAGGPVDMTLGLVHELGAWHVAGILASTSG